MEILKIRDAMTKKGISGKDLAETLNVTPATISNILNGKHFPKPELLIEIAKALDTDLPGLFERTKEITPTELIERVEEDLKTLKSMIKNS